MAIIKCFFLFFISKIYAVKTAVQMFYFATMFTIFFGT